jgi:hypothetical protein
MNYTDYPLPVVEDIARLRRRIEDSELPAKATDYNLLVGTWNIKAFGRVHEAWEENPQSPKRNLRAMAYIAEIVRRFDVIAIQEVKRDTSGIRMLLDDFLGPDWGLIISDVTAGPAGNTERLAFIYDRRRVRPSGLAGEIVLPPTESGDPVEQFARTPYLVGFHAGSERFALLTAHIKYGHVPEDRLPELKALAEYVAGEIRDRARIADAEEGNLVVLGDFNIDKRGDNPLFQTFMSTGLIVPPPVGGRENDLWHRAEVLRPYRLVHGRHRPELRRARRSDRFCSRALPGTHPETNVLSRFRPLPAVGRVHHQSQRRAYGPHAGGRPGHA